MTFISLNNIGPQVSETQLPLEARLALDKSHLEREQHLLNQSHRLDQGLLDLQKEYQRQILALVGENTYQANIEQWKGLRARFARLIERTALTSENDNKIKEMRRALLEEKHAFYHNLGFDIKAALDIRTKIKAKVTRLRIRTLLSDLAMPLDDAAPEPEPVDNPWTWRFPPYAHQWSSIVSSYGTAGTVMRSASSNGNTGEVKLDSWIELVGASDSDYLKTDLMSEVGFWFQMPAAGMLEVWAWYQDINTDYTGYLADESGCSDAEVHQLSRQYLWTLGSTERYFTAFEKKYGEDDEGSLAEYLSNPGFIIPRHFLSNKAYAAGEWVYASVGVRDFNYFWVNDMSCRSRMTSQYFVKQAAVRSTGAP
jgi:hypothetical protein